MIEVLEIGEANKTMVYFTVDETKLREKLFFIKKEAAIYYDKQGRKIGYHFILNPVTIERHGIKSKH